MRKYPTLKNPKHGELEYIMSAGDLADFMNIEIKDTKPYGYDEFECKTKTEEQLFDEKKKLYEGILIGLEAALRYQDHEKNKFSLSLNKFTSKNVIVPRALENIIELDKEYYTYLRLKEKYESN